METNPNRCSACAEVIPDVRLMDTGKCGSCGQTRDVVDPALADLYNGFDLTPDEIWKFLPRLRSTHLDGIDRTLGWTEIGQKVNQRIRQQMADALDEQTH